MGRSQSHDPGLVHALGVDSYRGHDKTGFAKSPLPRPLAGLERIASGNNVCRKGHGALPCKPEMPTSPVSRQAQERGRPASQHVNPPQRAGSARHRYKSQRSRALSVRRWRGVPKVEGEQLLWESTVSGIAVYERKLRPAKELPDPGGSGGEGSEGGGEGMPLSGGGAAQAEAYPADRIVSAHVWGHPRSNFSSVLVFPFDSATRTCSLIRQYCPGTGRRESSLPGARWEGGRGGDLLEAARGELRAEAGVHPYLVIDSQVQLPLSSRDGVEIEHGVRLDEVLRRVYAGEMLGPAAMASMMAMDKLHQLNLDRDPRGP